MTEQACTHCNGDCCYLDSWEGTTRYAQQTVHGKGAHWCKHCLDGTEGGPMSGQTCTHCNGHCCRHNLSGIPVWHQADSSACKHWCKHCLDGTQLPFIPWDKLREAVAQWPVMEHRGCRPLACTCGAQQANESRATVRRVFGLENL